MNKIINEIIDELIKYKSENTKKIYINHGSIDSKTIGVSIANMKIVAKKYKENKNLGIEMISSGIFELAYMAQWLIEPQKLSYSEIENFIKFDGIYSVLEYSIPSIIARSNLWSKCIKEWINSTVNKKIVAYATYSILLSFKEISNFDINDIKKTLNYIENNIHLQSNRVKYVMNGFIISVGIYVKELREFCKQIGENIGLVNVSMGKTNCKVPYSVDYITNAEKKGKVDKLRKKIC